MKNLNPDSTIKNVIAREVAGLSLSNPGARFLTSFGTSAIIPNAFRIATVYATSS